MPYAPLRRRRRPLREYWKAPPFEPFSKEAISFLPFHDIIVQLEGIYPLWIVIVSVKFSSVIHLTVDDYYLRGFGFISISV